MADALKETPVSKCGEFLKGLEGVAKNQVRFYELHKGIIERAKANNVDGKETDQLSIPESSIEKYNYYLSCLKSLIDHEKTLGSTFTKNLGPLMDLKQEFIALIKGIKDEESIKSHTYRIYSWHELH